MTPDPLPSALSSLDDIKGTVGGRRTVFFLDFDGTLSPIVERPEAAALLPGARAILEPLCRQHVVCFVSGRGLDDLRDRVALPQAYYAGDHGYRIVGPPGSGVSREVATSARPELAEAAVALESLLHPVPGALVEGKGLSLSVHYRLVPPERVGEVVEAVERARALFPSLRLTEGKCVFELRPEQEWDKGRALVWLMDTLGFSPDESCPICVGDDITDEDLFAAVEGWGVSVIVSPTERPTRAGHGLSGPEEVVRFLSHFTGRPD